MDLQMIILFICLVFDKILAIPIHQTAEITTIQPWPNTTIPYDFIEEYTPAQRAMVMRAIDDFHKYTCIRFVPRDNEDIYFRFTSLGQCSCGVGYAGVIRDVSLTPECLKHKSTVQHEMMHGLGFHHEHIRRDRDDYITVVWDNIVEDGKSLYFSNISHPTPDLGVPYDYASLMHYTANGYSIDGGPTLIPKQHIDFKLGAAKGLSELDILKVNRMYKCEEHQTREKQRHVSSTKHPSLRKHKHPSTRTYSTNPEGTKPNLNRVMPHTQYPPFTIFAVNPKSSLNYQFPSNSYITLDLNLNLNEVYYLVEHPKNRLQDIILNPGIFEDTNTLYHPWAPTNRLISHTLLCYLQTRDCIRAYYMV